MRSILFSIVCATLMCVNLSCEGAEVNTDEQISCDTLNSKRIAILGDSYSTYVSWIPQGYAVYYDGNRILNSVNQTWWKRLIDACDCDLVINSSYSGSTICNTGYGKSDYTNISFITRMKSDIPDSVDVIFVFGGTNDSWADSPIGELKYADWTTDDLKSFLPAACYLFDYLTRTFSHAKIINITNYGLSEAVTQGLSDVCNHYGVSNVVLSPIELREGHPTAKGMLSIAKQVSDFLNNGGK